MRQSLLFSRVVLLNLEKEKFSTTERHKWYDQRAVLFQSLLNQKDTQEKLGKLRFDLESSSNTNAIKKTVTEIISECGDEALRIKKRSKMNKKPKKPWYSENCTLLRKQFTELLGSFKRIQKNLI